jgi:predicted P-loop ATPase
MNPLIQRYGSEARWVNYKIVTKEGKLTKVPIAISGRMASSTDPKTWSTYAEAKAKHDNVGIIFTPEQTLLGIDIDHCLEGDKIVHVEREKIEALIKACDTYTEVSPSKTGLHLFLSVTESFTPKGNKKAPFELYTKGRYFTVTEMPYGEVKDVRQFTIDEINKILSIIDYPWVKEEVLNVPTTASPISLDDSEVLRKMFKAKNGDAIKKLYEGDISAYGKDESSADMALCMHLAFWTGKDASQIERIWTSSPLGSRKKTQDRKDYRDRTIVSCISKTKEIYKMPEAVKKSEELELLHTITKDGGKNYIVNTENVARILNGHEKFASKLRYDEFKSLIEYCDRGKWRRMEDADAIHIMTQISILFPPFAKVVKGMVFDAMTKVAKDNSIDSAADYIRSLKWDGTARLDTWLTDTYGAIIDPINRAIGSNWLKGLVKRIIEPGCKFDYVLVLEGPQGSKKSTSLDILGGDWHVETAMSTEGKDFFMQFQGKAIIELSEGETLNRTEVKRMKAIITTQVDTYRPSYGRTTQDYPRRCVFVMTTNQSEYLKDETGNRRWLPVALGIPHANIEWLRDNREQLFAEAYHRAIVLKESVHEFPDEINASQDARRISDPNADMIVDWFFNKLTQAQRDDGITIYQVYRDAIHNGYVSKSMNKTDEMTIADTLKRILRLDSRRVMKSGARTTKWFMVATPSTETPIKSEVEQILDGVGW